MCIKYAVNHVYFTIVNTIQADKAFGTDSCHEVLFCHFTHSFYRTLLGGVESLQSESGSSFCRFTKLGLLVINRTLLGGVEYTIIVI
jgi:hypothetical protein